MKLYSWLISFTAGVGGFLFGYEIGIINQVFSMDTFYEIMGLAERDSQGDFVRDSSGELVDSYAAADIKGWITFTFLIGCAAGAAFVSIPLEAIGRKRTIQTSAFLFMIGVALQTAASDIHTFYAGRVISGLGIGQLSATVPLYIAETSPTQIRGRLTSIYQLMITIGIFLASCVNSIILTYMSGMVQWRLAVGIQFIPSAVLIGLVFILPFSPRWLLGKGREEEALAVIARLREAGTEDSAVQSEYNELKANIQAELAIGNATWAELRQPGVRNRVSIAVILQFFQQWTGINIILYFGTTLFKNMGFPKADSSVAFIIVNNFINFVATFPGMWLIERLGRRQLLIGGGFAMAAAHFMITLFVGLSYNQKPSLAWGGMIFIFIFIIAFASTWGPVVWVYQSEIFSPRTSSKGTSVGTVSNWVWNAVISKVIPLILVQIGFYTYLIFAGFGIAMAIYTIFFVPETKGMSADEMDVLFGKEQTAVKLNESSAKLNESSATV